MTDVQHSEQVRASRESAIYRGCELQRAEIALCVRKFENYATLLRQTMIVLNQNFEDHSMVGVKIFSENIALAAGEAKTIATQTELMAQSLCRTFVTHLARRPR